MAIVWGSWRNRTSSHRQRIGIDLSVSGTTVTARYYAQTTYTINQTYTLSRSVNTGSLSPGSNPSVTWVSSSNTEGPHQSLLHTATLSGSRGSTYTFGASLPLYWTGSPATVSGVSIAIPVLAPLAPSAPTVTRNSDSSHTNNWTRNVSSDRPYASQRVQRRVYTAAGWQAWVNASPVLAGTATSWTDTSTVANRQYQWRVVATNAASSVTGPANATPARTTPLSPTGLSAVKVGNDIVATGTARHIPTNTVYGWQDNPGGTGWVTIAGTTPTPSRTFENPNPAVTHAYRARAQCQSLTSNDQLLASGYSPATNTVQLQTPPAAPIGLSPDGTAVAVEDDITLAYAHVSLDTTAQQIRQARYRLVGAGSWITLSQETTTAQTLILEQGLLDVGVWEWQVRTWGAHADPGPYSASAILPVQATPTATILAPDSSIPSSSALVEVAYHQGDDVPQGGLQVVVVHDGEQIAASGTLQGAVASWLTPAVLPDDSEVTIRARVRTTSGLWSAWDEVTLDVHYLAPVPPSIAAGWMPEAGCVEVQAQAPPDVWAVNLLPNPGGAEDGGWTTASAALYPAVWDAEVRRNGPRSRLLTRTASSPSQTAASIHRVGMLTNDDSGVAPVPEGETHVTGAVWVLADPDSEYLTRGRASVVFLDGGGAVVSTVAGEYIDTAPGEWTLAQHEAEIPGGAVTFRVASNVVGRPGQGNCPEGHRTWFADAVAVAGEHDLTNLTVVPPDAPETITLALQRSIGDGEWVTLTEVDDDDSGDPIRIAWLDYEAPLSGPLRYRAVAVSALPSTAETEVAVVSPHDSGDHTYCGIWINTGPGFGVGMLLAYNPDLTETTGLDGVEHVFDDRPLPVPADSVHISRTIAVTASILPDDYNDHLAPEVIATRERVRAVALMPGVHLYRDPSGVVVYGKIRTSRYQRPPSMGLRNVSFTLTETERGTDEQLGALHDGYILVEV